MSRARKVYRSMLKDPKYLQIVRGVVDAIRRGSLHRGDALPSLDQICRDHRVARETALQAYRVLKRRGIAEARPRRGYFVASEKIVEHKRVFLLFDEFTPYKQVLYNRFLMAAQPGTTVDIYFHHYSPEVFRLLIAEHLGRHDAYLIMPFPHPGLESALQPLRNSQVLLLDRGDAPVPGFTRLDQDFDTALESALTQAIDRITAYRRFLLFHPSDKHHPRSIITSCRRFCRRQGLPFERRDRVAFGLLSKRDLCLVIEDDDLVDLVEEARRRGWTPGRDLGVLSYNDTPMKRVIGDGISVVSIDFAWMGELAARFVADGQPPPSPVPTRLILRRSL